MFWDFFINQVSTIHVKYHVFTTVNVLQYVIDEEIRK